VAEEALPAIVAKLREAEVEVRGDAAARDLINDLVEATDDDWDTEYLDTILAVRIVDGLEEAVEHINTHSSNHTDSIVTENRDAAAIFLKSVDAASVLHNASTRFADGFRYGLGAEVGISTNRLHSRGPVGLDGLVIYKYVVEGDGHVAGSYRGDNPRVFTHRPIDETWDSKKGY
jgi:glutamate-5-semialdehyde dehydrogenase